MTGPGRTDRAERVIVAPPERVYAAMVDAKLVAEWLPPEGMIGRLLAFDPRPGGAFRMVLRFVSGTGGKTTRDSDIVDAHFVELLSNERVVFDVEFVSDDPALARPMRMTWSLAPHASGTVVSIVAENVPPGISEADHALGMSSSLANLAAFVER